MSIAARKTIDSATAISSLLFFYLQTVTIVDLISTHRRTARQTACDQVGRCTSHVCNVFSWRYEYEYVHRAAVCGVLSYRTFFAQYISLSMGVQFGTSYMPCPPSEDCTNYAHAHKYQFGIQSSEAMRRKYAFADEY